MRSLLAVGAAALIGLASGASAAAEHPTGCAFDCETTIYMTVTAPCTAGGPVSVTGAPKIPTPVIPVSVSVSVPINVPTTFSAIHDASSKSAGIASIVSQKSGTHVPITATVFLGPIEHGTMPATLTVGPSAPTSTSHVLSFGTTPAPLTVSAGGAAPYKVVVTDTYYHWVTGNSGPALETIWSTQTLLFPTAPTQSHDVDASGLFTTSLTNSGPFLPVSASTLTHTITDIVSRSNTPERFPSDVTATITISDVGQTTLWPPAQTAASTTSAVNPGPSVSPANQSPGLPVSIPGTQLTITESHLTVAWSTVTVTIPGIQITNSVPGAPASVPASQVSVPWSHSIPGDPLSFTVPPVSVPGTSFGAPMATSLPGYGPNPDSDIPVSISSPGLPPLSQTVQGLTVTVTKTVLTAPRPSLSVTGLPVTVTLTGPAVPASSADVTSLSATETFTVSNALTPSEPIPSVPGTAGSGLPATVTVVPAPAGYGDPSDATATPGNGTPVDDPNTAGHETVVPSSSSTSLLQNSASEPHSTITLTDDGLPASQVGMSSAVIPGATLPPDSYGHGSDSGQSNSGSPGATPSFPQFSVTIQTVTLPRQTIATLVNPNATPITVSEIMSTPCPEESSGVSQAVVTRVFTSTWSNMIVRDGATQTFYFPELVTVVSTVAVAPTPAHFLTKRSALVDRDVALGEGDLPSVFQESEAPTIPSVDMAAVRLIPVLNAAPLSTGVPIPPPVHPTQQMCSSDGEVGNFTIDFDDGIPNTAIFSPLHYLWFSEYFVIKLPGQSKYIPSSRGQLAEFVPPSRAPTVQGQSSDIAQIGAGADMSLPCYEFNWYSMKVGCESSTIPCEFNVAGYRWNSDGGVQEFVIEKTFVVPACAAPQYCPLSLIEGDGFENITSIFVQSTVNGDAATWWVDDLEFGWVDNSCTASSCRTSALARLPRREAIDTAIRRGIWQWTPSGMKRLTSRFSRRFF